MNFLEKKYSKYLKGTHSFFIIFIFWSSTLNLFSQEGSLNCFLNDFEKKEAIIPPYENYSRTTGIPTTTININFAETVSQVSKYIFGNAVAVWVSPSVNNPVIVGYLKKLSPSLIRFPGGSWSNVYFWDGNPGDLPATIPTSDGSLTSLGPKFGSNWAPTFDSYLNMRDQIGAQGLITINYGYARYGLSDHPAEQAAHYAAEWVRHDNGHTKFWEIGNENAGSWEAGWRIDTAANKDNQPMIITGDIYGKHFKIFADSMKKAAAEVDAKIYIGAIIDQFDASNYGEPDRSWNESVFREAGDAIDFYVIHNYFGASGTPQSYLNSALNSIDGMYNFIQQNIIDKGAPIRPVALTEWNISGGDNVKTSVINGMQGVLAMSEMAKLGYGMSARWLVANWEGDGMFYHNTSQNIIPEWNPRPDFYYLTYLQKYIGSHFLGSSVTGSDNIKAYTTLFDSGYIGIVIVNMGSADQTVEIDLQNTGYGNRYYYYSLSGGTDDPDFSKYVYVNDSGPEAKRWGPLARLDSLKARSDTLAYPVKIRSPKLTVQYILLETGSNYLSQVNVNNMSVSAENDITFITEDNGTLQFIAHIFPENATDNGVKWSASDSSVAISDQYGTVKAMYNGTAYIIATTSDGGYKDSIEITVSNQRYEVTGLSLITEGNKRSIKTYGGTLQIIPNILPLNAENKAVSWSVSDTSIAAINSDGLLTAKKDGRVTITCVTNDGNLTASISIVISGQTTGIQDISLVNLRVYPVPVKNIIYVENDYPVSFYEILNIEGKLLKRMSYPGVKVEIDIRDFEQGIYLIRAQTRTDVKVIRIIKI